MAEASVATPGSNADSTTPVRTPATKDKACPYCKQAFTSSSLGRHLDLYIREKNPKPDDGIHDAEKIKKERGGITRRQARASSVRALSTPLSSVKRSPVGAATDSPPSKVPRIGDTPGGAAPGGGGTQFNQGSWAATGVIRDLPNDSSRGMSLGGVQSLGDTWRDSHARGMGGNDKGSVAQSQRMQDALDRGRAAELALREVLDSVQAATARAGLTPSPLGFDPLKLTFPALVLRCLPPPPTLLSFRPFATPQSWPLDPPGQSHLESLLHHISTLYTEFAADVSCRKISSRSPNPANDSASNGATVAVSAIDLSAETTLRHVGSAFTHYSSLPSMIRSETWRLEIQRAYAGSIDAHKTTKRELDLAQQEIGRLKADIERLNMCQQPREFSVQTPTLLAISRGAARYLVPDPVAAVTGCDARAEPNWDYESIIGRWKGVVAGSRRPMTTSANSIRAAPTEVSMTGSALATPTRAPTLTTNGLTTTKSIHSAVNGTCTAAPALNDDMDGEADEEMMTPLQHLQQQRGTIAPRMKQLVPMPPQHEQHPHVPQAVMIAERPVPAASAATNGIRAGKGAQNQVGKTHLAASEIPPQVGNERRKADLLAPN